ncbi:hypothetical protein [Trichlorobacter lovleyi]|uniref:hypothetical protein n=1 Tax=Trichlorobacter lovleyi TaxID=313985 RepID=UPI00247FB9BA|nr:hypothetical protein [Trichlorobacter lovleyi]
MLADHERRFLLDLLEREPREVLALLAGQMLNGNKEGHGQRQSTPRAEPEQQERRAGEDPFLIDEEEFSRRARYMSREEQTILRCRVNAARSYKKGYLDDARRYRQRADRLEKKLLQAG